jgi:hypothetical protein
MKVLLLNLLQNQGNQYRLSGFATMNLGFIACLPH